MLNGGGLAQLQTINQELGEALQGRESAVRSTLTELDTFIGGLDAQKSEINRALDSANTLAGTLAARTGTIDTALADIGPGLDVINQQRDLLVSMLQSLARLGDVGTRIINESSADTVADLQLLQPILTQLAAAGPDLAGSLDLLLTYPFPASSVIGAGNGGHAAELPAGPAHRGVRAVHQHDGDGRAGPHPDPVPVRDRPGDRCAEDPAPDGHPHGSAARPAPRRATRRRRGGRRVRSASRPLTALPGDIVGQVPDPDARPATVGLPPIPGVTEVITRQTKLQLLAFAVVAVLGMSYLGFKYVGLDRLILGSGYDVAADFKDSGGIFVNAEVTYRGVAVGRVSDMKLIDDGVRVVLTMEPGADKIPADTKAVVATRSAVGEQYVLLQPDDDKGPYLKDGSVIPKDRTSIPVPGRAAAAQHGQARGLPGPGEPADRRQRARARRSPVPATTSAG